MKINKWFRVSIYFVLLPVLAVLAGMGFAMVNKANDGASGKSPFPGIGLVRPAFAQVAPAASFLDQEAGMSAYTNTGQTIDLNSAKSAFRLVERETTEWLIGWVEVPGYSQPEDARVFVHQQGWIVAYYEPGRPVARTLQWDPNNRLTLGTNKLQTVLDKVAAAAGVPVPNVGFFNFEFPNATDWKLILDTDSFSANIPSQFNVFDRSFSLRHWAGGGPGFTVDGSLIISSGGGTRYDHISLATLAPDQEHALSIVSGAGDIAISLLYQIP